MARKLASAMGQAGSASGAYVTNLTTPDRIYARRAGTDRLPASNEKLWTAVAALDAFGPAGTLQTTALATKSLTLNGTLDGDLYLRGGGDPSLTTAGLEVLAQDLADAGLKRVTGHVVGDESAFDRLRGPATFAPAGDVGGALGALVVDRGRANASDPARHAASVLARQLRDAGVRLTVKGRTGKTPAAALALATRRSPTIRTLIRDMNVPSDNFIAEMLLKAVGMSDDAAGTTARGAARARRVAKQVYGVTPRIVDGSGLARSDRTSPREVVGLLTQTIEDDAFFRSLAVMGRTGTLSGRLRSSPARGRCRGKTGTLRDVSALSGYCETLGGDVLAYSILMNRVNPYGARALQDRMVAAIVRFGE